MQIGGSVAKRCFLSELSLKTCYAKTSLAVKFITTSQSPLLIIRSLNDVIQAEFLGSSGSENDHHLSPEFS